MTRDNDNVCSGHRDRSNLNIIGDQIYILDKTNRSTRQRSDLQNEKQNHDEMGFISSRYLIDDNKLNYVITSLLR